MPALVSILIPAYNAERWLGETIESAMAQSWRNKEIIVVDDGSSDSTLRVAKSFDSTLVKVISQPNAGAAGARNRALAEAQGDYIQWLDADDLLAPDKLELQLAGGAAPEILLSSSFGCFYYRPEKARFHASSLWQDSEPVQWFLRKYNDDVYMAPSTWLVSRLLTEKAGLWDERLTLNDDGEYFARVVAACKKVRFVPEAKSYYRQVNTSSISKTINHRTLRSLFTSYTLCIGYLLALEESERTRAAAVHLLQNNLIYFYSEEKELLEEINSLAQGLGGTLSAPCLGWKHRLIRKLFGWRAAKNSSFALPQFKRNIQAVCDRMQRQRVGVGNPN